MAKQSRESDDDDDDYYETDALEEIHSSIVNNDLDQLKEVCRSGTDVNEKFPYDIDPQHFDMTPLALAAALDRRNHAKVLLDHGADINANFANLQTTALMTASFHGHVDVVNLLLQRGANPQVVDLQGSTALGYCFGGSRTIDVVGALLKSGVDVNQKNMLGMNALLLVAGYGNDFLVRMILEHGANPNSVNDFGHTALHLAVVGKRSLISAALSGRGSTTLYGLNRRNLDRVLVDWAQSHVELLSNGRVNEKELEKSGKFMMDISQKLKEPENIICSDDQEAMLKRLDAVSCYYHERLQMAKFAKKPGMMDQILSCGGRRSKKIKVDGSGTSSAPLERPTDLLVSLDVDRDVAALSNRCARIVKFILDAGCDVNKAEYTYGLTALDMAIVMGDVESTVMLLAAGGDPDHLLKLFAMTDLYKAITRPDKKKLRDLLNNDLPADVNGSFQAYNFGLQSADDSDKADNGLTPLAVAAKVSDNSTVDIIKILLNKGAEINKVGSGGMSPLGEACRSDNKRMVEFLLNQGADLEATNPAFKNATAVVIAVINKQVEIVEYLISKGAKIDRRMTDSRTSLIKALDADDMRMIDTLLENSDLDKNFCDRASFMFQMAEKYKEPNRDIEWILHEIRKQSQFLEEQEKRQTSSLSVKNEVQSKMMTSTQMRPTVQGNADCKEDEEEDEEEEEEDEENGDGGKLPPCHRPQSVRVQSKPKRPPSVDTSNSSTLDDLPTSLVSSKSNTNKLRNSGNIGNAKKAAKSKSFEDKATYKIHANLLPQPLMTVAPQAEKYVKPKEEEEEEEEEEEDDDDYDDDDGDDDDDDDDDEEEDDEEDETEEGEAEEEEPKLQLATAAPLSGVLRRPPNVRITSSPQQETNVRNIKVGRSGNNVLNTTAVTKTISSLSEKEYEESEEDDEEEGDEESEEEEEDTDESVDDDEEKTVNKKIEYTKIKRKPVVLSSSNSAETDI